MQRLRKACDEANTFYDTPHSLQYRRLPDFGLQ